MLNSPQLPSSTPVLPSWLAICLTLCALAATCTAENWTISSHELAKNLYLTRCSFRPSVLRRRRASPSAYPRPGRIPKLVGVQTEAEVTGVSTFSLRVRSGGLQVKMAAALTRLRCVWVRADGWGGERTANNKCVCDAISTAVSGAFPGGGFRDAANFLSSIFFILRVTSYPIYNSYCLGLGAIREAGFFVCKPACR